MPLHFTDQAFEESGNVHFLAYDGEEKVPCVVSHEALEDNCQGETLGSLEAYRAYAGTIQAIAADKYDRGDKEPDGRVLVRTLDFNG